MRKFKKLSGAILAIAMFVAVFTIPASAKANGDTFFDIGSPECVAKLAPGATIPRADNYQVAAHKWYEYFNGIRAGVGGWVNIVRKSDLTPMDHQTTVRGYWNTQSPYGFKDYRSFGTGKVYAYSGNMGKGSLSGVEVYYDF